MKWSYDVGGFSLDVESEHPYFFDLLDQYCGREGPFCGGTSAPMKISLSIQIGPNPIVPSDLSDDQIIFESSLINIKTLSITSYYPDKIYGDQPGFLLCPVWCLLYYLRFLPLHAGLVVHKNRPIAILGPGGVGKSTLSAALVERGSEFICDDHFFVIENNGVLTAIPFLKELKIRGKKRDNGRGPLAEYLRTRRRSVDVTCLMMLFPHYDASQRPVLKQLSPKEGIVRLMEDNMFLKPWQPDNFLGQVGFLDLLERLTRSKEIFELTYNDKDLLIACDQVIALLDQKESSFTKAASAMEQSQ